MSTTTGQLSPHFRIEEFACHDGTPVPTAAIDALREWCRAWGEPLRERFGPVRITSGFRTPAYNRGVGGAPQSYHVYSLRYGPGATLRGERGVAADCVPARGNPAQWQRWAVARMGSAAWPLGSARGAAVGYGSSGFVHLDTGPRRTWAG